MKTVFLHGLGQTAQDWKEVVQQLSISDVDCPELFSSTEDEISYSQILGDLEQRYSEVKEPLRICGLSLGALLAIDFAIRHEEKVDSLVLIGAQYKVPSLLIDFQNLIFRCMPNKVFESMEDKADEQQKDNYRSHYWNNRSNTLERCFYKCLK